MAESHSRPATYRDLLELGAKPPGTSSLVLSFIRAHSVTISQWAPGFIPWAEESGTFRGCLVPFDWALSAPKMCVKPPEDFAEEAFQRSWPTRRICPTDWKGPRMLRYRPPPSPDKVRVRWYPCIEAMIPGTHEESDLFADVPLEPNGDLDLRKVRFMWNMENCFAVDYVRLKIMRTKDPDMLSAFALELLVRDHERCLRVIEKPCFTTIAARERRKTVISHWCFTKRVAANMSWKIRHQPDFIECCLFAFTVLAVVLSMVVCALHYVVATAARTVAAAPYAIALTARTIWHGGITVAASHLKLILICILVAAVAGEMMLHQRHLRKRLPMYTVMLRIVPVVMAGLIGYLC